jgi:glutamate--cysteine ligase
VEYIEVRLMDLNPFEPIGIGAPTLRFLDVFLLHCLLTQSPPDTPAEIRELALNQHLTAARGREPGLALMREGRAVPLVQWGLEIIDQLVPIAEALDLAQGGVEHASAVEMARAALNEPERLPSARVLRVMKEEHGDAFLAFARTQSLAIHQHLLALDWSAKQQARFEAMAAKSVEDQRAIEAADSMPFEIYRQEYTSPARLGRPQVTAAVTAEALTNAR